MRIAYENLLKKSLIVATNENSNYPVENLYHQWKKKVFQATDITSQITVTFDEVSTVTAVCLGYHNLSACSVQFYDSTDTLLDTWTLDTSNRTEALYGSVSNVEYAVINATSFENVEIGLFFIGDSIYSLIEAENDIPLKSSDSVLTSSDRQISGRRGSSTRAGTLTIPLLSSDERKALEECFYTCGLIVPFFLDLWNSSHDDFEPVYCVFTSDLTVRHTQNGDTITFSIQEVN